MARSRKNPYIFIVLLLAVAAALAFIPTETENFNTSEIESVVIENIISESDLLRVIEPDNTHSVLIQYAGFDVSFNPGMHQPNYAAWQLTKAHTDGQYSRKNAKFSVDEAVNGCASLDDYRNSGFDRGHMAPAADMKWSQQAMNDCHYLTNICPQDSRLNGGAWATIEKNCRKWAQRFGTVYIIAGPVLTDRLTRSIGETPVPVPERFFKVVIAPNANPPIGIAFMMPNKYFKGGAQQTVTSIDQIEAITGYDFFSALPDDIENTIEAQHTFAAWNY